jgi:hypothetical protein
VDRGKALALSPSRSGPGCDSGLQRSACAARGTGSGSATVKPEPEGAPCVCCRQRRRRSSEAGRLGRAFGHDVASALPFVETIHHATRGRNGGTGWQLLLASIAQHGSKVKSSGRHLQHAHTCVVHTYLDHGLCRSHDNRCICGKDSALRIPKRVHKNDQSLARAHRTLRSRARHHARSQARASESTRASVLDRQTTLRPSTYGAVISRGGGDVGA